MGHRESISHGKRVWFNPSRCELHWLPRDVGFDPATAHSIPPKWITGSTDQQRYRDTSRGASP